MPYRPTSRAAKQPRWITIPITILLLLPGVYATAQTNLLSNSSMEHWHSSGVRANGWGVWTPDKRRHTWKIFRDDQTAYHDRTCMRVRVDDWVNLYAGARVQPGKTYTYSLYVRCDQAVSINMRFSVWGPNVPKEQREGKARPKASFKLEPNQWARIHVTDTMPTGAERATLYTFVRGKGTYHFDAGMLNEGGLTNYIPGPTIEPVAMLNRPTINNEIEYVPTRWNTGDQIVDDQDIAFAFDTDVMSLYRMHDFASAIGATFQKPVQLRGIYLLLNKPAPIEDFMLTVEGLSDDKWQSLEYRPIKVGTTSLLQFGHRKLKAVRIRFKPNKSTHPQAIPIYHFGFAQ